MRVIFLLVILSFFTLSNALAEYSISDKLGFPELPQLGVNLTVSSAISNAIVHPEKQYPDVTDGVALKDEKGNLVVVNDVEEPTCVFYGTHSDGYNSGGIISKVNINNLQLNCD